MSKKDLIDKLKLLLPNNYCLKSEKGGIVFSKSTDKLLEVHMPYSKEILNKLYTEYNLSNQDVINHFKEFILSTPFK